MIFNEIKSGQLQIYLESNHRKIIIPCFLGNVHFSDNTLLSLILYDCHTDNIYSYNISHPDLSLVNFEVDLYKIYPRNTFIYEYKYFHKYWNCIDVFDLEMNYWLKTNTINKIDDIFIKFKNLYKGDLIGKIIPFTNFYSHAQKVVNLYKEFVNDYDCNIISEFEKLQREVINLEYRPLPVNLRYSNKVNRQNIYNNYNFFTLTGRPSNTYRHLNLSALNKNDGSRKLIVTNNSFLVEFDFNSSHLNLLAKLLSYSFNGENPHEHFSKIYTGKDDISLDEYNSSKQLTFKQLYGNDDVFDILFFKKVRNFRKKLFEFYSKYKYLQLPISKRKISNIENVSESKLLNYFIQGHETDFSMMKIKQINSMLDNKKTNLLLWVYDSFLIDYAKEDGLELLFQIKSILEDDMQVHIRIGPDYHNMIDKTAKFDKYVHI